MKSDAALDGHVGADVDQRAREDGRGARHRRLDRDRDRSASACRPGAAAAAAGGRTGCRWSCRRCTPSAARAGSSASSDRARSRRRRHCATTGGTDQIVAGQVQQSTGVVLRDVARIARVGRRRRERAGQRRSRSGSRRRRRPGNRAGPTRCRCVVGVPEAANRAGSRTSTSLDADRPACPHPRRQLDRERGDDGGRARRRRTRGCPTTGSVVKQGATAMGSAFSVSNSAVTCGQARSATPMSTAKLSARSGSASDPPALEPGRLFLSSGKTKYADRRRCGRADVQRSVPGKRVSLRGDRAAGGRDLIVDNLKLARDAAAGGESARERRATAAGDGDGFADVRRRRPGGEAREGSFALHVEVMEGCAR